MVADDDWLALLQRSLEELADDPEYKGKIVILPPRLRELC